MIFESKPLAELIEADIRALHADQSPESKTLDYKRELPGLTDAEKKEFLFDISSFANASGGYLVYGIDEQSGIPKQVPGLVIADADAEIRRLQSLILDGVEPRIPGLDLRFVPFADGKKVLVIRVPKSWALPHMVTFRGTNKFYSRNAAGKHPVDVGELRTLFNASQQIAEQVKRFRTERISQILAGETPLPLQAGAKTILHIVSLEGFTTAIKIDLKAASALPAGLLCPLGASGYGTRVNLDGLVNYTGASAAPSGVSAYLQLYRNGAIETVDANTLDAGAGHPQGRKIIPSALFERSLTGQIPKYLLALQKLGYAPPFAIMLTLIGVKGYSMALPPGRFVEFAEMFDRDVVLVSEVLLEGLDCTPVDLKPMLDAVWNAGGVIASPNIN